jgi:hypothetical protein
VKLCLFLLLLIVAMDLCERSSGPPPAPDLATTSLVKVATQCRFLAKDEVDWHPIALGAGDLVEVLGVEGPMARVQVRTGLHAGLTGTLPLSVLAED